MSVVGDEVLASDRGIVALGLSVVGDEVLASDRGIVALGLSVVGDEVVVSGVVGKGIVTLGLTRVGYGIVEGLGGPKHRSSSLCGKFSQVNILGH